MSLSAAKRPVHRGPIAGLTDLNIVPGTPIYTAVHLWYIYTRREGLYPYNTSSTGTRYHLPVACKGDIDLFGSTSQLAYTVTAGHSRTIHPAVTLTVALGLFTKAPEAID